MAGIYVHIPFCQSRCIYCSFFSTTSLALRHEYVDVVLRELSERKDFLAEAEVETIYFGGGTPSQLPKEEIERILRHIYNIYNVCEGAEITLEGNPDDMTLPFLQSLRHMGINRLSMGVQTFDDERLKFLHRRHTAERAMRAVQDAQAVGFDNISIDLMFGFPKQTLAEWREDVRKALALNVQHISAYSLMYEEGTFLGKMLERGEVAEVNEEVAIAMYYELIDALSSKGYEHYELSNFALCGKRSRHNSSYWRGVPYLGVGAGAHSFDGKNRCSNVESLSAYMTGALPVYEELTEHERYDEFVFTGLRTAEGISLAELAEKFGERYKQYCLENAQKHLEAGRLILVTDVLKLTRQGLFVSNDVMSDLMWVE